MVGLFAQEEQKLATDFASRTVNVTIAEQLLAESDTMSLGPQADFIGSAKGEGRDPTNTILFQSDGSRANSQGKLEEPRITPVP